VDLRPGAGGSRGMQSRDGGVRWLVAALCCGLALGFAPPCQSVHMVRRRCGGGSAVALRMAAVGKKSKLMKAIQKPRGTIAVMAELKKKDPGTPGLEFPIPSIEELSQCLNTAKVQSIAVWTDEAEYGTTMEDLAKVAAAQQKFKGNFPGPAPVLMLSKGTSADDIRAAAAAGAAGVLLSVAGGEDALSAHVQACVEASLEAVVICRDGEEAEIARRSGAQVVAFDSKALGIEQTLALAECGSGAAVLMALGGIKTLDDAWKLRDAGFGCIVVGEELLATTYGRPGEVRQGGGVDGLNAAVCKGDTIRQNDLNTFIKALGAKASIKFGPTGVNSFREKGANAKRHYVVE
jgi:indole-3-glycerol phosphate synthase